MSSGTTKGAERSFSEQIGDFVRSVLPHSIPMNGFTDEEAKKFLQVNNLNIQLDDVKLYCGTNPYLLSLLLTVTPISLYKSEVQQTVTNFVCQNLNVNSINFKMKLFLSVCRVYFDLEATRSILVNLNFIIHGYLKKWQ